MPVLCARNIDNICVVRKNIVFLQQNLNVSIMLGINNNDEIVTGKYADALFEEYKKRHGKPAMKYEIKRN